MISDLSKKELLKLIEKSGYICFDCGFTCPLQLISSYDGELPILCKLCHRPYCRKCLVKDGKPWASTCHVCRNTPQAAVEDF